ncbi:MAG TPA: hypothetical protein VF220_10130 [Nitrososphaeraceae archaeon]
MQSSTESVQNTRKTENQIELMVLYKGIKYGAFAGFLATWAISSAIVAAELILGLRISTFYSIIGISLGSNDMVSAGYIGFGLHILVGTLIGALLGAIGIRWKKIRMLNPFRSALIGIGAGFVIWLVVFLPITALLIQPSIQRIVVIQSSSLQQAVSSDDINSVMTKITLAAIAFHMIWGAIFGFILSSLLRIRLYKIRQHFRDIINIDPRIRLVTICDSNGNVMLSRHKQGVQNLLDKKQSKKSLDLAMDSWKERNEISEQIGSGKYVLAEYDKIKRITLPFGENLLLYITTEVDADHSKILNRIHRLEAGLQYLN